MMSNLLWPYIPDPASQDVGWPIRFKENTITSVCFTRKFELHHGFCMSRVKYCATLDPNGQYRQWARPSKELNAAECEGLASETRYWLQVSVQ